MPKMRFRPGPLWGAYSALSGPLAGFRGPTSKRGEMRVREGEGRGGRGRGGEESGREGKGSYWYFFLPTFSCASVYCIGDRLTTRHSGVAVGRAARDCNTCIHCCHHTVH